MLLSTKAMVAASTILSLAAIDPHHPFRGPGSSPLLLLGVLLGVLVLLLLMWLLSLLLPLPLGPEC
jgi:hypothetical protein